MRFKTQQFLALMYAGRFVDPNALKNGIYDSSVPALYPLGTTIENLIKRAEIASKLIRIGNYIDNVKKCNLVPITISIEPV